ncbi:MULTISPECIES: carbohydrate-binding family 9-like protein [Paenibacillus]|uniref:carbohydrate-binding family 9-like protein n=1 Tax=Paenibacillus TaxID=44249 RepID=UPI0022B93744|nr:carbohydrate-binding family 9-like protein [Paenibacillus caseinilyticus]MCZ8522549.1 carbohydrate-binding family 9-like protein [Paenibacillus caseinilyticus]
MVGISSGYAKVYRARFVPPEEHGKGNGLTLPWPCIERAGLVDAVTGLPPAERTEISVCWNPDHVYVRFYCQDRYTKSSYTQRDEPLYEQDVVELFIDEQGEGTEYLEIEVSPNNVIFDAMIRHDGIDLMLECNTAWNMEGLVTSVYREAEDRLVYDIRLPAGAFLHPLTAGTRWRVNFYRIDEQPDGRREYQAWSPTGAAQFHRPLAFGWLVLG